MSFYQTQNFPNFNINDPSKKHVAPVGSMVKIAAACNIAGASQSLTPEQLACGHVIYTPSTTSQTLTLPSAIDLFRFVGSVGKVGTGDILKVIFVNLSANSYTVAAGAGGSGSNTIAGASGGNTTESVFIRFTQIPTDLYIDVPVAAYTVL